MGLPTDPRAQRAIGHMLATGLPLDEGKSTPEALQQILQLLRSENVTPEMLEQLKAEEVLAPVAEEEPEPTPPNEPNIPGVELLRAKDLARMAGATPYDFRCYLRTTEGGFQDKKYTRYGWDPSNKALISSILTGFKAWKKVQDALKVKRKAERDALKAQREVDKAMKAAQQATEG